jgi:hypothetical protein
LAAEFLGGWTKHSRLELNGATFSVAAKEPSITVAEIGMIRGDLWTVATVANALPSLLSASGQPNEVESARELAVHAARLAPHDARNWLVLSVLDVRLGRQKQATEAVKLSYYTGPNEIELVPLRLQIGVDLIEDEELQVLVRSEFQRIILKWPGLKPTIASAYKQTKASGGKFLETVLAEADPRFLAAIKEGQLR